MNDPKSPITQYLEEPHAMDAHILNTIEILEQGVVESVIIFRSEHRSTIICRLDVPQDLPDVNKLFGPAQS
jgi:hypothetical protein